MFKDLSLNQFMAKFLSICSWGIGGIYLLYGIFILWLPKLLETVEAFAVFDFSAVAVAQNLIAVFFFVLAIYSFITAYGLGKYKNFGRIMLLIPLYLAAISVVLFIIGAVISMFTSFFVGLVLFVMGLFYGFVLYLLIYLFQSQKEMKAVFK